jgi:PAS domain S-box-containing protein
MTFKGNPKRLEAIAVRIELGGKAIIQATWLDITARYRAAQDLRDSEAKFRAVAESMTAGITIFDANKLLYCNPASSRITGYSHEELLTMNFWEMIHPSFRELVLQRGRDRIAGAEPPPRYEVKIIRKDGEERWIDYSAQVIQFMGATCVLGTTIDITDRVTAEEELQRVYQERYQQVREIAGGVSHEIYNSLFPATTSLYKLRERLLDRSDQAEQIERDLKLIGLADQAIARAIHMTESVTHYSRLEANRKIEHVPLREVIDEIIEHNRARLDSQGVKFESAVPEDAIVACGRLHLYSLLNNLVVNALDALLETEQPVLTMTVHLQQEHAGIQISDNGPGIEPENLSKIFNAFFSTKPRSGTGLGLAMVRKIAEMYGGTIKVSSIPHKKTTFDVVLPRPTPEAGGPDAIA